MAVVLGGWLLTGCAAHVAYVETAPPAARVEARPARPYRMAVWIPGHWAWRHGHYMWIKGHWEKARRGHRYVPGHWEKRRRGWIWIEGGWHRRR